MNSPPYNFLNNNGDTLTGSYYSSYSQYQNDGNNSGGNENTGISYQYYNHVLKIDTFLYFETNLKALLSNNSIRSDQLNVSLTDSISGASLTGTAESDHEFNSSNTIFHDSIYLNSVKFTDVYSSSGTQITLFVNRSKILAGFVYEGDTFHLAN